MDTDQPFDDEAPFQEQVAARPDDEIVCVDCGGRCFLLTAPREEGSWYAGDIVSYRCRDCLDRWDIELPPADDDV